jgi:hypothetical protein
MPVREFVIILSAIALVILLAMTMFVVRRNRGNRPVTCDGERLPIQPPTPMAILAFGPANSPLIEVFDQDFAVGERREEIPLWPQVQAGLNNLLPRLLPIAGSAANVILASNTYVMRFAPEIAKRLADKSLTLMEAIGGGYRASAVGAHGIAGNATLFAATGAQLAATTMAVWQVMAFITAQKFLSDINKHLAQLETEIHSIKEWLENDRLGKLLGDLAYLKRLSNELVEEDLPEGQIAVYAHKLEDIDLECMQIMVGLRLQIESERKAFKEQPLSGGVFWVSADQSAAAQKRVSSIEYLIRQHLLANYIRCLANQLKCALPKSNRSVILTRMEELHEQHLGFRDQMTEIQKLAEERIPELKGSLTRTSVDAEHQGKLKEHVENAFSRSLELWQGIGEMASGAKESIRADLEAEKKPLSLAVTIDSEGVVRRLEKITYASEAGEDTH